jgi:uncharacterized protein (TIGR03083 family)
VKRPGAISVLDRFAPLRRELLDLLAALRAEDWARPTAAPRWSVKDVVAHLWGGDVGILSRRRDRVQDPGAVAERDLVSLVNRLNAEWVVATRRLSPGVLRELLARSSRRTSPASAPPD